MSFILDDSEVALLVFSEVCTFCIHWSHKPGRECVAFPGGIPLPIWLGENDHWEPFPGDGGVQFAPIFQPEAD